MISIVDHRRTPLLDQVIKQAHCPHQRFYMPGHKGGRGSSARMIQLLGRPTLQADVPELPGLDQLFAPSGVIEDAQALAADAFGAEQTFFLINGTSVGLMAAVMSICGPGEQIIVPRNCHQSILHGLILSGAHPIWVYPDVDPTAYIPYGLHPETLQLALARYPNAKAAIAVSPTYEGVCCDLAQLVAISHDAGIPLIVDEAHGAHLCFHPALPPSALSQGADLVAQSTHKTLGALTQASMLHVQGDRIDRNKLQTTLTLLQSSSPNYLLLASLDAARHQMMMDGHQILEQAIDLANSLRKKLTTLSHIQMLGVHDHPSMGLVAIDPLKLTLKLEQLSMSGFEVDECLDQNHQILAEFPTAQTLTFLLGQGSSSQDLDQLFQALSKIERQYSRDSRFSSQFGIDPQRSPTLSAISPRDAFNHSSRLCTWDQATGHLSAKLVCPYPPGIPIIFPGEEITSDAIEMLKRIQRLGGPVIGVPNAEKNVLEVLDR